MSTVVLVCASSDEAAAQRVAGALESLRHRVLHAQGPAAEREVIGADVVLVLRSKAAATSDWVRPAASIAARLGKLVLARIEPDAPPAGFDGAQVLDMASRRTIAWRTSLAKAAGDERPLHLTERAQ